MAGLSVAEVHTSKEGDITKIGIRINKKLVIAVACFAMLAVCGIVAFRRVYFLLRLHDVSTTFKTPTLKGRKNYASLRDGCPCK